MTFHQSEVMSLAWGDEAAALVPPQGYRGEMTIAMRSTKVRDVGGWVAGAGGC